MPPTAVTTMRIRPWLCTSCLLRSQGTTKRSVTTISAIHNGVREDIRARELKSRIALYEERNQRARFRDDRMPQKDESEGTYGSVSIPHTTAASKFIYGYSSVLAALKAKRRKLYKLYYHPRASRRGSENEEKEQDLILDLASAEGQKLQVKRVDNGFLPVMDKISEDRPHNGVVLETSPLPYKPVNYLAPVNRLNPWFLAQLRNQSPEERMINGTDDRIRYNSHGWRYPLVLFLHNIVDSGNLGAVIRSAHYLGVDAIAMANRNTASVDDPVVIKASSGATEAMQILQVHNPFQFLTESGMNGWRVYAAEAPQPISDNLSYTEDVTARALDARNTSPLVSFQRMSSKIAVHNHFPLAQHPTILMMGGEHSGISQKLLYRSHYQVGIRGVQALNVGVDSLNVSVASALIMLEMLKKPANMKAQAIPREPKPGSNLLF